MSNRRRNELAAAILLSLIPAILLYWLFQGQNVAEVIKESEGIKLGGPTAFFFIVLGISLHYLGKTTPDSLFSLKQDLQGKWEVTAKSSDKHHAVSETNINLRNSELDISGGQFLVDGEEIGSWSVDHLLLTKNKMVYIYRMRETGGKGASWKGIVELNIPKAKGNAELKGGWESIGPVYKSGIITYEKRE